MNSLRPLSPTLKPEGLEWFLSPVDLEFSPSPEAGYRAPASGSHKIRIGGDYGR